MENHVEALDSAHLDHSSRSYDESTATAMQTYTTPDSVSPVSAIEAPLTFQQQWFWNLLQRHQNWNWLVRVCLRISGPLDISALEASFDQLIRRHDALRTRIIVRDGVPVQQVNQARGHPLASVTPAQVLASAPEADVKRCITDFLDRGVNLATGPLLKVQLLQVREQEHVLVVAIHHVIADGSALNLMFREIWLLYADRLRVCPAALAGTPPQHSDYALRQRSTHELWEERHGSYWRDRLAGATCIRWPLSNEGLSHATSGQYNKLKIAFGEALTAEAHALARSSRTYLSMIFLAAYVATLSRWCNQRDFVLPFVVAGRQDPSQEGMIGNLYHMLHLRMELRGDESLSALLSSVTQEFYRGVLHQDSGRLMTQLPELQIGTCVNWLPGPPREAAGLPPPSVAEKIGIRVEPFPFKWQGGKSPPTLQTSLMLYQTPEGVMGSWLYRSELFSSDAMQRFVDRFRDCLEAFVRNPATPINEQDT